MLKKCLFALGWRGPPPPPSCVNLSLLAALELLAEVHEVQWDYLHLLAPVQFSLRAGWFKCWRTYYVSWHELCRPRLVVEWRSPLIEDTFVWNRSVTNYHTSSAKIDQAVCNLLLRPCEWYILMHLWQRVLSMCLPTCRCFHKSVYLICRLLSPCASYQ